MLYKYKYILFVSFPSDSHPPTASSCPFAVTQLERVAGTQQQLCPMTKSFSFLLVTSLLLLQSVTGRALR